MKTARPCHLFLLFGPSDTVPPTTSGLVRVGDGRGVPTATARQLRNGRQPRRSSNNCRSEVLAVFALAVSISLTMLYTLWVILYDPDVLDPLMRRLGLYCH